MLFSMVTYKKMSICQYVNMHQPLGFETDDNHLVCKFHKVIYGLKQTPRSWFQKLSTTLHFMGFNPTKSDASLFIKFA